MRATVLPESDVRETSHESWNKAEYQHMENRNLQTWASPLATEVCPPSGKRRTNRIG